MKYLSPFFPFILKVNKIKKKILNWEFVLKDQLLPTYRWDIFTFIFIDLYMYMYLLIFIRYKVLKSF